MKFLIVLISGLLWVSPLFAATDTEQLRAEVKRLQQQTQVLTARLDQLNQELASQSEQSRQPRSFRKNLPKTSSRETEEHFHSSLMSVHVLNGHPDSFKFYPTALVADEHIVTYIAGTPVVASPYLGSRPAFDGSDYIVNVSSINRDVRLMQQRRRLYRAYQKLGYPVPNTPILALSGKVMPVGSIGKNYVADITSDWDLGSSELDVAAALNDKVEAYISVAYDSSPPATGGQRVSNSSLRLGMGFVNIGNLDQMPFYFSAGQMLVPFGSFSSAMVSAPLTLVIGRTLARPFVVGYKSQYDTGPFAAIYAFEGDTTLGTSGVGGVNAGYVYNTGRVSGQVGASYISSLNNSSGMQFTGSRPGTTFAGFSSPTNGSEAVRKTPGVSVHGNIRFDRYNLTGEWVGVSRAFRPQDLSFNGRGARPQAGMLEAGVTFSVFDRPASAGVGHQWSTQALALNVPKQRVNAIFSMSIWKDTVESVEYRHDSDYNRNQVANGAAPAGVTNVVKVGTGQSADALLARIGVYF